MVSFEGESSLLGLWAISVADRYRRWIVLSALRDTDPSFVPGPGKEQELGEFPPEEEQAPSPTFERDMVGGANQIVHARDRGTTLLYCHSFELESLPQLHTPTFP